MEPQDLCRLTPEELQKYSAEHLWYEVWMFFQTGIVLPNGVTSPKVDFVENAILESFAIHLRNLLDFFYPDRSKPHDDDVIAAYYFDARKLPSDFPQKSKLLNASKVRAHKQVSHLTTKRFTGNHPEKRWSTVPLMSEIAEVLVAFVGTASPDRLAPEFIERTRVLLKATTATARH
jgi:hypothetical protein